MGMTELTVEMFDQAGIDLGELVATAEAAAGIEEREEGEDDKYGNPYGEMEHQVAKH